jgi:hypothetical protein
LNGLVHRWLLFTLLVGLGGGCEGRWRSSAKADVCDPTKESRLVNTVFWSNTFGKRGYARAVGCLRLTWGQEAGQGVAQLVEVTVDGTVYGWSETAQAFTAPVALTVPASVRQTQPAFRLFIFGQSQSIEKLAQTCTQTMAAPGYVCLERPSDECLFYWAFRPTADGRSAAEIPGLSDASCRLVLRSFVTPTEPMQTDAAGSDVTPKEPSTNELLAFESTVIESPTGTEKPPERKEPIVQDSTPEVVSESVPPEPTSPDTPSIPHSSLKWCKKDTQGQPVVNAFYQACDSKTESCAFGLCHPKCSIVPPVRQCPTTAYRCSIRSDGFCFLTCQSTDNFKSNFDASCPVGYVCNGPFVNPGPYTNNPNCGPSQYIDGYATGSLGLGASCTKDDGCDGRKGWFCLIPDKETKGVCQRACDPRPGGSIGCPAGQACRVELRSFLQGMCQ